MSDKDVSLPQTHFPFLTVKDVAKHYQVNRSTVVRWIEKGRLEATIATQEQLGQMIMLGLLRTAPTHGLYLVANNGLDEQVARAQKYPEGTRRPRKGTTTEGEHP